MIDVEVNNIWLPLPEDTYFADEPDRAVIIEASVRVQRVWEKAPVFEDLQVGFWYQHFGDKTDAELTAICDALGIPVASKKSADTHRLLTEKLTRYFSAFTEYAGMHKYK